jgi:predicted RNA-binding protein with PUA-like domain
VGEAGRRHWLLKSEPSTFSFDDLRASPRRTTRWEGVRNYQARNLLREMKRGDQAFFYHSNADPPAVVGTVTIVREAYPDADQFDPRSPYHDPGSDPADPRWVMVDVRYGRPLRRPVTLPELRAKASLAGMVLLRKGSRLSVQPVTAAQWRTILKLGGLP